MRRNKEVSLTTIGFIMMGFGALIGILTGLIVLNIRASNKKIDLADIPQSGVRIKSYSDKYELEFTWEFYKTYKLTIKPTLNSGNVGYVMYPKSSISGNVIIDPQIHNAEVGGMIFSHRGNEYRIVSTYDNAIELDRDINEQDYKEGYMYTFSCFTEVHQYNSKLLVD